MVFVVVWMSVRYRSWNPHGRSAAVRHDSVSTDRRTGYSRAIRGLCMCMGLGDTDGQREIQVDMNKGENNDAWTGNLVRAAENMCTAGTAAGLRFIRGKCKNRENAIKCIWPPLPCGWLRCVSSWDNFLCSRFGAKILHISHLSSNKNPYLTNRALN